MTRPFDLKRLDFSGYPPEAQALAVQHLDLLRTLPLSLLPLILREAIGYDWRFPAERKELDDQFAYLQNLTEAQLAAEMSPFAKLALPADLEQLDWVNKPEQFSEKLSAHLWATNQMDAFRQASIEYVHHVHAAKPATSLSVPRLGIVVIGKGVRQTETPLFRKLRPHGVLFNGVGAEGGLASLLNAVKRRAQEHPVRFGHWYIDGERCELSDENVTCISYQDLQAVRTRLLQKMVATIQEGRGPEALRTELASLQPAEVELPQKGTGGILSRFQLSLLTEGSGTQIFSTTFAQWAAREALRRAQPLTLLVRFAPRQRESSFTQLNAEPDPERSLVDADMSAYYTWINQRRLSGADESRFLVWFEEHNLAFAAGPGLKAGTTDSSSLAMRDLLTRIV